MPSSTNINNRFFEGSYKHVWRAIIPEGLTEAEVDFLIEVAGLKEKARVLDIMCGYGRHAFGLSKKGISVTAVDNLQDYIREIGSRAEEESLPLQAVLSGALEVELSGTYDAAICMGNSFAFFPKEDAILLLKKLSSHLNTGGCVIINSWMIGEIAIRHFKEKDWYQLEGFRYLLDNQFCFHPTRIESEQTIVSEDGSVEEIQGIDYIFSLNEMEMMFREAGLVMEAIYSTPRKRNFAMGDGRIYMVARKP